MGSGLEVLERKRKRVRLSTTGIVSLPSGSGSLTACVYAVGDQPEKASEHGEMKKLQNDQALLWRSEEFERDSVPY